MGFEEVLEANLAFYRAFNQKDTFLMEQVWAQKERVTCIHPGWNLLEGREAVMASWARIMSNPDQGRIVVGGARVAIVGGMAVLICRELAGGAPLLATNLFVQEDEEWRLIHHHSGPVAAAE